MSFRDLENGYIYYKGLAAVGNGGMLTIDDIGDELIRESSVLTIQNCFMHGNSKRTPYTPHKCPETLNMLHQTGLGSGFWVSGN